MKNLKISLREGLLIQENLNQAESILRSKGVDLLDRGFVRFKQTLIDNHNLGYLGPITKIILDEFEDFDPQGAFYLYDKLRDFKHGLHLLERPWQEYTYEQLYQILPKLPTFILMHKLSKKLTNPRLQEQLTDWATVYHVHGSHDDKLHFFFEKMDSVTRQQVLRSSDRFNDVYELFDSIEDYRRSYENGFNYKNMLDKLYTAPKGSVTQSISRPGDKLFLIRVHNWDGARHMGQLSWCIARDEEEFRAYTRYGDYTQYYLYHFEDGVPENEQALAFTLTPERKITSSMDRLNNPFPQILEHLKKLDIEVKQLEVNKPPMDIFTMEESVRRELRNIRYI